MAIYEEIDIADDGSEAFSLNSFAEIIFPCLDAVGPETVAEIGSYEGGFTEELLAWSEGRVKVIAIDPEPLPELVELCERRPELELIREASHDALRRIELPDVVIIDGDHNYYTVSEELRLIGEKAEGSPLPLVFFHDVCWPHARRDAYYVPERIPADARQRMAEDAAIAPGEPGIVETGLSYRWVAEREGGSRNGVLTAIEDFIADRDGLRYVSVPAFFGLGVLWSEDAPWAGAVAEIVDPWNENPLLQRLETNRIRHMANSIRADELEGLLRVMLGSRAFTWAEWLSRLNQRGKPMFSREKVRAVLGDDRIAARGTPERPTHRGRARSSRRAS